MLPHERFTAVRRSQLREAQTETWLAPCHFVLPLFIHAGDKNVVRDVPAVEAARCPLAMPLRSSASSAGARAKPTPPPCHGC